MFSREPGDTGWDRVLAWFAGLWIGGWVLLFLVGVGLVAYQYGLWITFRVLQKYMSPFNLISFVQRMIALAPGLAALVWLHSRRTKRIWDRQAGR